MELVEDILLEAWLSISLFAPLDRWRFFSSLSLVSRGFRDFALWVSTRHVRLLSHSSMDVAAYRSIGQQCIALQQHPSSANSGAASPADQEKLLRDVFKHTTVHLDVTYESYTSWYHRDRWLEDHTCPLRPDDRYGVQFDFFASPFGEYTYPYPERRAPEYRAWLASRRRDCLSGWFADVLAAIPDCAAVMIEGDPVELLGVAAYSTLLEALWWWGSLEEVRFASAVPGPASFGAAVMGSTNRGPLPPFPELASVRRVWLAHCPRCTCRRTREEDPHAEECITRRMLEPFPGLQSLRIGENADIGKDIVVPSGVEVSMEAKAEEEEEEAEVADPLAGWTCKTRTLPPRWVPQLKLSKSDTLWELVDPVR